jgi:hypothetical protein
VFTDLDSLLPVLDAAIKYQMKTIVDELQTQIMFKCVDGKTYREPLLYDDPLGIYVKAKELDLVDLADAAANATLNIDVSALPDNRSDVANMPALWLWQLLNLRKERTTWLLQKCGSSFPIVIENRQPNSGYNYSGWSSPSYLYSPTACSCYNDNDTQQRNRAIPATLLDLIKLHPCARAVRRINFNYRLRCLRCGAAAAIHFNAICDEYEREFGIF